MEIASFNVAREHYIINDRNPRRTVRKQHLKFENSLMDLWG